MLLHPSLVPGAPFLAEYSVSCDAGWSGALCDQKVLYTPNEHAGISSKYSASRAYSADYGFSNRNQKCLDTDTERESYDCASFGDITAWECAAFCSADTRCTATST